MPGRHLNPRNLGVVELLIRSRGRTIVQIFRSLNVLGRFLVARRRLVAEPAYEVIEGLPSRLDLDGLEVNLHHFSPSRLVCPSMRCWTSEGRHDIAVASSSCAASRFAVTRMTCSSADRKSVVVGKGVSVRVDLGGRSYH